MEEPFNERVRRNTQQLAGPVNAVEGIRTQGSLVGSQALLDNSHISQVQNSCNCPEDAHLIFLRKVHNMERLDQ